MVTITLASPLFELIPQSERARVCAPRCLELSARSWQQATGEIRDRFPDLADRVLTDSDQVAMGFVLVVNDAIVHRGEKVDLDSGDRLHVLAQIAGGC